MGAEQLTIEVLGRLNEGGDIVATQDTICIDFARLLLIMTQLQTYLVFFVKSVSLKPSQHRESSFSDHLPREC